MTDHSHDDAVDSLNRLGGRDEAFTVDTIEHAALHADILQRMFGRAEPEMMTNLGRYELLRRLGGGSMGVVYLARDPELRRKVALKLLHPRLRGHSAPSTPNTSAPSVPDPSPHADSSLADSPSPLDSSPDSDSPAASELIEARIRAEARAMAQLAHPHVVHVYDVGRHEGRLFITMEYVPGSTMTGWLLEQPRTWREILRAFVSAGRGLAAAHAAGLVHRDFKPDNVLVGHDDTIKVTDFGLALPTAQRVEREQASWGPTGHDSTADSSSGASFAGTLAYMSPEQWLSRPLDARSDQFSFCVALYESIYGQRAFAGRSVTALMFAVTHGKLRPPPRRCRAPAALHRILVRGLAADADQRWPSMDALLEALQRLLRPRRRILGLSVLGLSTAAVGVGAALYSADVLNRCTAAADQLVGVWDPARKLEVKTTILGTDVSYAPGTWLRVEQLLDDYADAWIGKHTEVCEATRTTQEQSEDQMTLRMACLHERRTTLDATVRVLATADARIVENATTLVAGLPPLTRCDDLIRLQQQNQRMPPPEDPQVAREVEALRTELQEIKAAHQAGRYARALEHIEPMMSRIDALGYGPLVAETKHRRGSLKLANGQYDEAERDLREAYGIALRHDHEQVELTVASDLAYLMGAHFHRYDEGWQWGQTARALAERMGDDRDLATSMHSLGNVRDRQGKYEEAEALYRTSLSLREKTLGDAHPDTVSSLNHLGNTLDKQGKYEEAETLLRRSILLMEEALGDAHPRVAKSANDLGSTLCHQGRYAEGVALYEKAFSILERALGDEHPDAVLTMANQGNALRSVGRYEEAEAVFRRALSIRERVLGADHPLVATTLNYLGVGLAAQGKHEEAEAVFRRALSIREEALGEDHPELSESLNSLGGILSEQGKQEEAEALFRRALTLMERTLGEDHPHVAASTANLGATLALQGKREEAAALFRRALTLMERTLGEDHPSTAYPLLSLVEVTLAQNDAASARAYAERALSVVEGAQAAPKQIAEAQFMLARSLSASGVQPERARALAQRARDLFAGEPGQDSEVAEVEAWLGR